MADQAREPGVGAGDGAHQAAVDGVVQADSRARGAVIDFEENGAGDFEQAAAFARAGIGGVPGLAQDEADQLTRAGDGDAALQALVWRERGTLARGSVAGAESVIGRSSNAGCSLTRSFSTRSLSAKATRASTVPLRIRNAPREASPWRTSSAPSMNDTSRATARSCANGFCCGSHDGNGVFPSRRSLHASRHNIPAARGDS